MKGIYIILTDGDLHYVTNRDRSALIYECDDELTG